MSVKKYKHYCDNITISVLYLGIKMALRSDFKSFLNSTTKSLILQNQQLIKSRNLVTPPDC